MLRLYCIFSKESIALMKGNRGKLAAQAGHAFLHSVWDAEQRFPDAAKDYRNSDHAYKITLVVETTEELCQLYEKYSQRIGATLVKDAGFTVFNEPTITCIGVGPVDPETLDDDIKKLKVLI